MNNYGFETVDSQLAQSDFRSAKETLENDEKKIYSSYDEVLKYLDYGVLSHYSRDFEDSNEHFTRAETLMDKFMAISVSQIFTGFVVNDTFKDYAGEDYENIYSNIFMALNYVQLKKYDEAMVEVRRFDNKIKELKRLYEKEVEAYERDENNKGVQVPKISVKFSDSALARYLSMLLYRNDGDWDNAALDLQFAIRDFKTQPTLYNFSVPSALTEEKSVKSSDIRLNVLAFTGNAPDKVEENIRVYYDEDVKFFYKLSLPQMQKRESQINAVDVDVTCIKTGKKFHKRLEKLESIENIALDTFQQRYSMLYAKSLARSIVRAIPATVCANGGWMGEIFALLITEYSETADIRCTRYFPATASITGLTLPYEGEYEVQVSFMQNGYLCNRHISRINVKKGTLNLVESACLR